MDLFEKRQMRIGTTPWEAPTLYAENSPISYVPTINAPVLVMHNDHDGAVSWEQGMELYLAMRRLGKEIQLFNYRGEDHSLLRRENAQDWDSRMREFFDYYLMGAPKPKWMQSGGRW
jgi:dipeptidyl aminopeptidase/acylaminoacyl peptidase